MKQAGAKNGAGLCKQLVMRGTVPSSPSRFSNQDKCLNDLADTKEAMRSKNGRPEGRLTAPPSVAVIFMPVLDAFAIQEKFRALLPCSRSSGSFMGSMPLVSS